MYRQRGTISAVWFGDLRNSQGNLGTEKLFTGQILDDTGLYYYGARYYDSAIGRFISPDTFVPDATNPQAFNRYSYVLNNPLKYIDPTGRYWQFDEASYMDIWYDDDAPPVVAYTLEEMRAICDRGLSKPGEPPLPIDKSLNLIQKIENAVFGLIGGEITSFMNTALAQDIPLVEVTKGSILDHILPSNSQSLFPLGIFTNEPMDLQTKAEEGYHWNEQKNSGSVAVWYGDYINDYGVGLFAYNGNTRLAHDIVPAEQRAMKYAADQTRNLYTPPLPPTNPIVNWMKKLFWH